MSSPLETVHYNCTIFSSLEFIRKKKFKRLVVSDENGKVAGVTTQTELLRLVNNRWMEIIKQKGNELSEINQKLMEKTSYLEQKASTDYLTQLYNRRKFDAMVDYEIKQVKRYKTRNLSIILFDIDNFKKINDTHGHDIGDKVLQSVAHIIKVSSRDSDVAARWGGEEFVLMLPETNIEQGLLVAEKIRITIENHIFANSLKVTCSAGVAQFHTNDEFNTLYKRADSALYNAKNSGKNKVQIESI
jgi:diguanylate cyclase (GGDEF)-like protein